MYLVTKKEKYTVFLHMVIKKNRNKQNFSQAEDWNDKCPPGFSVKKKIHDKKKDLIYENAMAYQKV